MSTNKSFSSETSERYSRALFEVANESKELDKIENDILETKILNKSVSLLSETKSNQISRILNAPNENKVNALVDCLVS